jgi:hypothetical protein
MKCSEKRLSIKIYEGDKSTRRRQIEAPRTDLRSRNPMVVAENCLATCDGHTGRTHRYVVGEGHHTYRKELNLRAMRDGGIIERR